MENSGLVKIEKNISCPLHEDLNVLYIVDSNICSSVIQKRTHFCISMATYH